MTKPGGFVPLKKVLETEKSKAARCEFCGAKFTKERPFQKFCSTEHRNKYWMSTHPRAKKSSLRTMPGPEAQGQCLFCGEKFPQSRVDRRFCDQRCQNKYYIATHPRVGKTPADKP